MNWRRHQARCLDNDRFNSTRLYPLYFYYYYDLFFFFSPSICRCFSTEGGGQWRTTQQSAFHHALVRPTAKYQRGRFHFGPHVVGSIYHSRSDQSFLFYIRLHILDYFLNSCRWLDYFSFVCVCVCGFSWRENAPVLQRDQWRTSRSRIPSSVLSADWHSSQRFILQTIQRQLYDICPHQCRSPIFLHHGPRRTGKDNQSISAGHTSIYRLFYFFISNATVK